jgi:hypothetical protein
MSYSSNLLRLLFLFVIRVETTLVAAHLFPEMIPKQLDYDEIITILAKIMVQ